MPWHNGGPTESPLKPIGVMSLYDVGGVLRVPQLGPHGEMEGPAGVASLVRQWADSN